VTPTRLLMIDVADIQDYIFGSNNLQQNLGASELVTQATSRWIFEVLKDLEFAHNGEVTGEWLDYVILNKKHVAHELDVEVIYAGGGNAALLFVKEEDCRKFVRQWTRRVFDEARGLQPKVKSTAIKWDNEALTNKLDELRRNLHGGTPAAPLLGLGVTAACVFTGLPATTVEDDKLISTVVKHKLKVRKNADERLHNVLPQVKKANLDFIYDFDQIGTADEFSYLAVIHIDGNRMGKRRIKFLEQFNASEKNDACVVAMRKFSQTLQQAAAQALKNTVDQLLEIKGRDPKDGKLKFGQDKKIVAPRIDRVERIPFRPIVFGGDDVTFVCDGRLGLSLAAAYLQAFAEQTLADGEPAYARAGVAIMKSHFPFSRSYELAEQLCASAKEWRKDICRKYDLTDALTMDWHFSTTGMVSDLKQIRKREYTVPNGELYMRPIVLSRPQGDEARRIQEWRTWPTFNELVRYFKEDEEWKNRRNKVKALRTALRAGPDAVELFWHNYAKSNERLKKIAPIAYAVDRGWDGPKCVYFDAIEAMDFFTSLKGNAKS